MSNPIYNPIPRILSINPQNDTEVNLYLAVMDIPNSMCPAGENCYISSMTPDPTQPNALCAKLMNMQPFPTETLPQDTEFTTFLIPMLTSDTDNFDNNRMTYDNLNVYDSLGVEVRGKITKSKSVSLEEIPPSAVYGIECNMLYKWRPFVIQNSSNDQQFFVGGLFLNNADALPNCPYGSNGIYQSSFNYLQSGISFGIGSPADMPANTLFINFLNAPASPSILTIAGTFLSTYKEFNGITNATYSPDNSYGQFDYDHPVASL